MLGAAALGVGGASVVTADPAPDLRAGGGAVGGVTRGSVAADPAGGPPWEVRSYESQTGRRCIAAARTDGTAFGPADASGRVRHADPELAANCDDAAPLVVALAEYVDVAGTGARSVLFGVAGEGVADGRRRRRAGRSTVARAGGGSQLPHGATRAVGVGFVDRHGDARRRHDTHLPPLKAAASS